MKKVVIIDYQLGNLFSVNQALENIGLNAIISSNPADINLADALVLPGVGAFGDAMNNLKKMGLIEPLKKFIAEGKPFLGICLGLQLLFSDSEEFGSSEGLNIIAGTVKKFPNQEINHKKLKVPQIAWNSIHHPNNKSWKDTPLENIKEGENFYFVHSFYVEPKDKECVLTNTTYGSINYTSSILKDNIFACQFHPEKSADKGLEIYKNWAKINKLI